MSDTNRSRYQQEMDQIQLSDKKADETLRMMLESNARLREEQVRKTNRPKSAILTRRILPIFAATAACVALVIFGLSRSGGVIFGSVRMRDLPVSGISRGEDAQEADFETAFGCTAESLFPGWKVTESKTLQYAVQSESRYEGKLTIEKQGKVLSVSVVNEKPAIYQALSEKPSGLENVYLNLDPDDHTRYAVTNRNNLFITFSSSSLSENDFVNAVKEITGTWKTNGN